MGGTPGGWFSRHLLWHRPHALLTLLLLSAALDVAGAAGMAYVAGFAEVDRILSAVDAPWFFALVGGLALSFAGYLLAYRRIYRLRGGPALSGGELAAVSVAGFNGFLTGAGSALDRHALQRAGADDRDTTMRLLLLSGLEQGALALLGTAAAIAVLAEGLAAPDLSYSLPWAVIPVPCFVLAFWLAWRYRGRFRTATGWRRSIGLFIDTANLARAVFLQPHRDAALLGMTAFWVGDAFAVWAALAAFGLRMDASALFVGFATGLLFTRRTAPVSGAGVLLVILSATIWISGAPLATAVVGVFVYRVLVFWLPLPFSLGALPVLRGIGRGVPAA